MRSNGAQHRQLRHQSPPPTSRGCCARPPAPCAPAAASPSPTSSRDRDMDAAIHDDVQACTGCVAGSADPSPEFETVARRGRARRRQALPGRAQPLTRQECLTPPQSPTIQGYRRRTPSRIGEQNCLLIQPFSPMSPVRSWWIAPRRSPAGVWTSDPAWSPKRRINRPKPTAQRRDTVVFKPPICRRSAALAAESRLPENRGVPGPSPGLAIRGSACSAGTLRFLQHRRV